MKVQQEDKAYRSMMTDQHPDAMWDHKGKATGKECNLRSKRQERYEEKGMSGDIKPGRKVELDQDLGRSRLNLLVSGREATYERVEGTRGREQLKVVDIAVEGLPMADGMTQWGATLVGVVTPNVKLKSLAESWFPGVAAGSGRQLKTHLDGIDLDAVVGTVGM